MSVHFFTAANGLWQTASDWFPNSVPGSSDSGTIGFNGTNFIISTVTSDASATVGDLVVDGGSTLDIDGGTTFNAISGDTGDLLAMLPVFDPAVIAVQNSGTFELGEDGQTQTFSNSGIIKLLGTSNSSGAPTFLTIAGTVNLTGAGEVVLTGNFDFVNSDGNPAGSTLNLEDSAIVGAGVIGDSNLTLDNVSGIIAANVAGESLDLDTGTNTILNGGTIESTVGGELSTGESVLEISSPVDNTGSIMTDGGVVAIEAPITGAGSVDIGRNGILEVVDFGPITGSISGDVQFTGGSALLALTNISSIGGDIVGAAATDEIDLATSLPPGAQATWQQNGATGTLSLGNHGIPFTSPLNLAGQYTSSQFNIWNVGSSGFSTVVALAAVPSDFQGNGFSDFLWRNSDGTLAEWLMNGSTIASAPAPTFQGSPATPDSSWSLAATGDFNGDGAADMLWRQNTGALRIWTMDGSTITSSSTPTFEGTTPMPDSTWSIAGVGDFESNFFDPTLTEMATGTVISSGDADILWRQSSTGDLAIWLMNGSTIVASTAPTFQGSFVSPDPSWSVAAIGDFGDTGNSDILWRQNTGALAEWSMVGTTIESSSTVTFQGNAVTPDSSWSVAAVGNFDGNGAGADILWRQASTNNLAMWIMNGATVTSSAAVTFQGHAVTPDSSWNIVEVGDFTGSGNSDIIWQQSTTGAVVEWQMNGAQVVSSQTITSQGAAVAPGSSWKTQSSPTDFA